jgi:undecaprenyl-diphosphatase
VLAGQTLADPRLDEDDWTEEGEATPMWPLIAAMTVALAAGGGTTLLVRRWPRSAVAAPRVAPSTIRGEVQRHGRVAAMLRSRITPDAATGLALTVAALLAVGGGVMVGVLLFMVRQEVGFARWDLSAARWGAQHASETSTDVLRSISVLGGTAGVVVVTVAVAVLEHRRIRSGSALLFLLLVVVGQNLLANGIKALVDRARPDLDQLTGFAGSSFPSGHSAAAAATFAAIALVMSRRRGVTTRALLAGGAMAVAVAVAATRVFLGVHWLTDVLAGLALGWAWFALCSIAFGGRFMHFAAPALVAEHAAEEVDEGAVPAER